MNITATDQAKADAERAQARQCYERAAESFERCDTDGFLSQWASQVSAQEHNAKADLIEAGGKVETWVLTDLDGNVVSTHQGFGKYGEWWRLDDEAAARYGKRFYSPSNAGKGAAARLRDRAKGFTFALVSGEGEVAIVGGVGTAHAVTRITTRALIERDFTIVQADYTRRGVGDN